MPSVAPGWFKMKTLLALVFLCAGVQSTTPIREPMCPIPLILSPICGTDGRTYSNKYELACRQKINPDLKAAYHGYCKNQGGNAADSSESALCGCPRLHDPVCGSNGVTYGNSCELKCQQRTLPNLKMRHSGPCQSQRQPEPQPQPTAEPEPAIVEEVCSCPRILREVCGSNGETYPNKCLLDCLATKNPGLVMRHEGRCQDDNDLEPDPQPDLRSQPVEEEVCPCPRNYRPVCGSNGQTYANKCLLDCQAKKNPDLKVRHEGACNAGNPPQPKPKTAPKPNNHCICPMNYLPVCGSDGKTYPNKCALDCQNKKNKDLTVKNNGACQSQRGPTALSEPVREDDCPCSKFLRPVCASDGRTYTNICLLRCESRKRPGLTLRHNGACKSQPGATSQSQPAREEVCICPYLFRPVCGSNGQTYSNKCLLDCQAKRNPNLTVKHNGACQSQPGPTAGSHQGPSALSKPFRQDSCPCPRNLRPVCGSNSRTYSNKCLLDCEAKRNPDLTVKHNGSCQSQTEPTDGHQGPVGQSTPLRMDSCPCPRDLRPVCGSNGQTYSNECLLNCEARRNPGLKMKHSGGCQSEESSSSSSSESA